MSPCQSEPPLMAMPSRCAMPVIRRSVPGEWLGCRTSRPSRPCSWNCRIWPSEPWSPRWAATAIPPTARSEEHTSELQSQSNLVCRLLLEKKKQVLTELKNTRLNSSHSQNSYAVLCLNKTSKQSGHDFGRDHKLQSQQPTGFSQVPHHALAQN